MAFVLETKQAPHRNCVGLSIFYLTYEGLPFEGLNYQGSTSIVGDKFRTCISIKSKYPLSRRGHRFPPLQILGCCDMIFLWIKKR